MNLSTAVKIISIIGLAFGLNSCFSSTADCDSSAQKTALRSEDAQFKQEVIKNMPAYVQLKDFILKNLPAILAHNDKRSLPVERYTYAFFDYGKGNEIKDQVPEALYPELKKIYQNFNKDNFYSVHFVRDSSIIICITNPSVYNQRGIGINHSIRWENPKYNTSNEIDSISKDTTINGAVYTVFVDCYRGI